MFSGLVFAGTVLHPKQPNLVHLTEITMKNLIILTFGLLFLAGCSREYYKTSGYYDFADQHKVIAFLPVQTITTGRIPRGVTDEMLDEIEENESRAFQMELHNQVSRRTHKYENPIRIKIQHVSETNAALEKAGIGIRESWGMAPTELARILGVDAVVYTSVTKAQYLTDLESFGLSLAFTFASVVSDGFFGLFPGIKTSDVFVSCSILDGQTGVSIWATERECPTDWNRSHSEVVRQITGSLARRFPYRE